MIDIRSNYKYEFAIIATYIFIPKGCEIMEDKDEVVDMDIEVQKEIEEVIEVDKETIQVKSERNDEQKVVK